jgi:hypothetical protein
MLLLASRILSLLVAIGYVVAAVIDAGGATAEMLLGCLVLLLPLALIWFPEEIGDATGFVGRGHVDAETPAVLVSIMGWFLLVGLPVVVYFVG